MSAPLFKREGKCPTPGFREEQLFGGKCPGANVRLPTSTEPEIGYVALAEAAVNAEGMYLHTDNITNNNG